MFSKAFVVAALATAAVGVVGCGSDDDSGGTPVASGGAVAAELPKEIRSKGTLTVAADATYPPNEFLAEDGKTIVGMSTRPRRGAGEGPGHRAAVGERSVRRHPPRPRGRQVRHRLLELHRHEGAREDGRLRDLLLGRHVVLCVRARGRSGRSARSRTSAATRSPSRRARSRPTTRPRRQAGCKSAGEPRLKALDICRTSPPPSSRFRAAAPMSPWPTPRSPPTRSRVRRALQARRQALRHGSVRHRGPEGSRAWRSRCCRPSKAIMRDGSYDDDPEEVGRRGRRDRRSRHQRRRRLVTTDAGVARIATDPVVGPEAIRAVPVRHPGQWVAAALVLLAAAALAWSVAHQPALRVGRGRRLPVLGRGSCRASWRRSSSRRSRW